MSEFIERHASERWRRAPPQALLLDFDGVIVDSVRLKVDAFLKIYEGASERELAAILEHQRSHGGVTRRLKFRHFEEKIFGRVVDDARIEALSERFTAIVHEAVLACPFIAGALDFLRAAEGTAAMHVISGTPLEELSDIVERRGLQRYFASLHGAPESKPAAFARIVQRGGYDVSRVLAIGDATTEYHAAAALGISFVGIVSPAEPSPFPAGVETQSTLEGLARRLGYV